eukprot:Opistho-2@46622
MGTSAGAGRLRYIPAVILGVGWVLLFIFNGKLSYDAEHPTNHDGRNSVALYSQKGSGAIWFYWAILVIQFLAFVFTIADKPIIASRFVIATAGLMFFYFNLTSDDFQPCAKRSYRDQHKDICHINALGTTGAILTFAGSFIGALMFTNDAK